MNNQRFLISGAAGTTEQVTSTDSAQNLPDSTIYQDGDSSNTKKSNQAVAVFITCEDNDIRYAFNAAPTQDGGTGLGHVLAAGDAIRLTSWSQIKNFQYISKVSATAGTLQMTAEY